MACKLHMIKLNYKSKPLEQMMFPQCIPFVLPKLELSVKPTGGVWLHRVDPLSQDTFF